MLSMNSAGLFVIGSKSGRMGKGYVANGYGWLGRGVVDDVLENGKRLEMEMLGAKVARMAGLNVGL